MTVNVHIVRADWFAEEIGRAGAECNLPLFRIRSVSLLRASVACEMQQLAR